MNEYPKILIFGQPFNNHTGGGITLTNLFKGWPKDKIAVAYPGHGLRSFTTNVCDTYYQLGMEEYKWAFPFNLLQRPFPSGIKKLGGTSKNTKASNKHSMRFILVNRYFYPFLRFIGLYNMLTRISVSRRFNDFLKEYDPDILYLQVSARDEIRFAMELISRLRVPSVLHNMDDWPSTIGKGIFKKFWTRKIDSEFKELLNMVNLHLSISDAMSEEYYKRYKVRFKPFHNPIEISRYNGVNIVVPRNDNSFRILYAGRIGIANQESLRSFAQAVAEYNRTGVNVELDIYSSDHTTKISRVINNLRNVNIREAVAHDKVFSLFSRYDVLLLPLDFTSAGMKYAQFSMPTKASEYMISGTPVLVYSPSETAVSKFFRSHECGYCVTTESKDEVTKALDFLVSNEEYRKKISRNAVLIARERFDAQKVRGEFHDLLINLQKKESYV